MGNNNKNYTSCESPSLRQLQLQQHLQHEWLVTPDLCWSFVVVGAAVVVVVGLWSPSSIAWLNGVQFDYSNMNYSSCSLNGQLWIYHVQFEQIFWAIFFFCLLKIALGHIIFFHFWFFSHVCYCICCCTHRYSYIISFWLDFALENCSEDLYALYIA